MGNFRKRNELKPSPKLVGRFVCIALLLVAWVTAAPPLWQSNLDLDAMLRQHRAQPSDWNLCNQIAIAYTQTGQFDNAAAFYRKVLLLKPGFIPARKNLGVVLWYANRKGEAEKMFRGLLVEIPKDVVPHLYTALRFTNDINLSRQSSISRKLENWLWKIRKFFP